LVIDVPVELSVKTTVNGAVPLTGVPVNEATGAENKELTVI